MTTPINRKPTKIERRYRKDIAHLRTLFLDPTTPWVPIPMPRSLRTAARHLVHKGFLTSESAVKKPGHPTVVIGYNLPERPSRARPPAPTT